MILRRIDLTLILDSVNFKAVKLNIILINLLFITCFACETVVDFELEAPPNKLVPLAVLEADSTPSLMVNRSFHLLARNTGIQESIIKDARVTLKNNSEEAYSIPYTGKLDSLSFLDALNSGYESDAIRIEAGEKYTLNVSHNDFSPTEAEVIVPEKVDIRDIDIKVSDSQNTNFESNRGNVELELTLENPAGDNFFLIAVTTLRTTIRESSRWEETGEVDEQGNPIAVMTTSVDTFESVVPASLLTIDPTFEPEELQDYNKLLFNDNGLSGSEIKVNFSFNSFYLGGFIGDNPFLDQETILNTMLSVNLIHLDQGLYRFLTSRNLQRWNDGDPFAEPVQIYSNMTDGLGILGAMTRSNRKYDYNPENGTFTLIEE